MRYVIKTKQEPVKIIPISYDQLDILKVFANQRKLADLSIEYQINDCVFTVEEKNDVEYLSESCQIGKTTPEEHPTYPTDEFSIMQNVIWHDVGAPLKPNFTDKPVEKDYEILQMVSGNGNWFIGYKEYVNGTSDIKANIHSVKRLSDGKVFKIGDNTTYGKIESFQEEVRLFGKERTPVILVKMDGIASFVQFALL